MKKKADKQVKSAQKGIFSGASQVSNGNGEGFRTLTAGFCDERHFI